MQSHKKVKVALVMPNHADMNSSLNNYVKTYQQMVSRGLIEVTLFTDEKANISIKGFTIEKIRSVDFGTAIEKVLFVLGIPRQYYLGLKRKLDGFDVIVANNPEFYAYSFQAYRAARAKGVRLVLRTSQTVEGFYLYRLTKFIVNPIVRAAYAYASKNIFSNPQAEQRCINLGLIKEKERRKSVITGHATDTHCFKPMSIQKPDFPVLLSVGGLYKVKGHHYIIRALKKIHEWGFEDAQLWIVGKGVFEEKLRLLSKELGIENKVKFFGSLCHKELAKMYNKTTVFILSNEQEITPAVNEALACGIPTVVSECGGRSYVIPNENYSLIAKSRDPESIAKKVITLLKNKKLAQTIATRGRRRVLEKFSIEVVVKKFCRSFV